jgi:hypothetical protein
LKHSEVGVALLTHPFEKNEEKEGNSSGGSGTNLSTAVSTASGQQIATENKQQSSAGAAKKPPAGMPSNAISRNEARGAAGRTGQPQLGAANSRQQQMQVEEMRGLK